MKAIKINSVNAENCSIILSFEEKESKSRPWNVRVECVSPELSGKINTLIENDYIGDFIEDLKVIERDRRGQANIGYQLESGFSLKIYSVDSLGHFIVDVTLEVARTKNGADQIDSLKISYEIEPSSLSELLENFQSLYL